MVHSHKASLAWQGLQGDALKGPALQGREGSQAPQGASPGGAQLRVHACSSTRSSAGVESGTDSRRRSTLSLSGDQPRRTRCRLCG